MFFKRSQQSDAPPRVNGEVTTVAAKPQPLEASELRRVVEPATLGFKTTDELHPITGLIGQDRALKAIQFGANIKSHDFNMFVLGPAGLRQDHGRQGAPRARRPPSCRRRPTGSTSTISRTPTGPRRCSCRTGARKRARQGHGGGASTSCAACCRRCSRARTTRSGVAPSTSSSAPARRRRWRR